VKFNRQIVKLCTFLLVFLISTFAYGSEAIIDIENELSQPGVKLVVVEFYATWCKPCMEAVPEWKRLHQKYKNSGLKFIVVSADEGVCSKPVDWAPDKSLCDPKGKIRQQFARMIGAEDLSLPTSFLFSWEGKLSLNSHHVEPVDKAIANYFKDTQYKIEVEPVEIIGDKYAIGSNPQWVRDEIVSQLKSKSKVDVVSERNTLGKEANKELCDLSFPANSTLHIKLQGFETGERMLSLKLEKDGCVKGQATRPYSGEGFREDKKSLTRAISRAMDDLLAQVIRVRIPELVGIGVAEEKWFSKSEAVVVRFEPEPEDATVLVDDKPACDSTPCSETFQKGHHEVTVFKKEYLTKRATVEFKKDMVIDWELVPDFGWLNVITAHEGVAIEIDGEIIEKTPIYSYRLAPGLHRVKIKDRCYYQQESTVRIERNKTEDLEFDAQPIQGGLDLMVRDNDGNAIRADVYIDGEKIGTAPGQFKVSVCAEKLEMRAEGYRNYTQIFSVEEKQMITISALLDKTKREQAPFANIGKKDPGMSSMAIAGWSTLATGAASILLGGIMTKLANDEASSESNSGGGSKSSFDAYKYTAIAGYTIGGALIVTGVVLFVLDPGNENSEVAQAIPAIGTDGKGVSVSWNVRF